MDQHEEILDGELRWQHEANEPLIYFPPTPARKHTRDNLPIPSPTSP